MKSTFLLAACVLIAGSESDTRVDDKGSFFKKETVQKALAIAQGIAKKHKLDVVVETFATLPDNDKAKQKEMEKFALDRAEKLKVHGFYLFMCKKPPYLRLVGDIDATKDAFKGQDDKKLVDDLIASFRKSQYDEGLLHALTFMAERVEANLKKGNKKE